MSNNRMDVDTIPSQYVTFFLESLRFGIDVQKAQEIIRYQEMTQVPLASSVVRGLVNLRGQILPAIDLRRRLGMGDRKDPPLPMNIVIRTMDGVVSLLVDTIGDVIEVERASFEPTPPTLNSHARKLVQGIFKLKQGLLLILDVERAVDVDGLEQTATTSRDNL